MQSDERAPTIDHIYRECLKMHRAVLKKSISGFFAACSADELRAVQAIIGRSVDLKSFFVDPPFGQ